MNGARTIDCSSRTSKSLRSWTTFARFDAGDRVRPFKNPITGTYLSPHHDFHIIAVDGGETEQLCPAESIKKVSQ